MRQLPDGVYYELEALHEYSIDIEGRELFLAGEPDQVDNPHDREEPGVEFMMANRLIKNMRFLTRRSDNPILVHLKTCGGDWHEGMAIYDTISTCPARVVMLNYTHARSMSSIIFQAADRRIMMPDSIFMFHLGTYGTDGTQRAVDSEHRFYSKSTTKRMIDIYVDAIKASPHSKFHDWEDKKIYNMLNREMEKKEDVYLTAEQTVDWGLADEIFDGKWKDLITK